MTYVTEVKGVFGGWSQVDRGHLCLDSATKHAQELVKKGHKPENVRVIKVVAEFEPTFSIKVKGL